MSNYITIDGGTTNTRICLVSDGTIIDRIKLNVGVRKNMKADFVLKEAVRDGIKSILELNGFQQYNINKILASGMITSEYGLFELQHISVPAGIGELHTNMVEVKITEISDIPFVFIPGVRTACTSLENADVMRGEETELIGLAENIFDENAYILPGSHSKCIITDKEGRISDFFTSLTGEMLVALKDGTILKNILDFNLKPDEKYLAFGYEYCENNGFNEALFKVRILNSIFKCEPHEVFSFFLGTVLHDEIKRTIDVPVKQIVIGGRKQLKEAMAFLLCRYAEKTVVCIPDETAENASAMGIVRIYEYSAPSKTSEPAK